MTWDWLATGIGLTVGMTVGFTGLGAGSLLTPLLVLVLGADPITAVGTALAHAAVMKAIGTWRHSRLGTIQWSKVRGLALGSVPATLAAALLLGGLQRRSASAATSVITTLLGVMLVLAAAGIVARSLGWGLGSRWKGHWLDGGRGRAALAASGAAVGVLVALTSVGSGSFLLPILALGSALPACRLVGTDMAHALVIMAAGAVVHVSFGHVSWPLVASLLAGSIPGIWLGSHVCVKVPEWAVQGGIAAMLLTAGLKLV